MNNFTNDSNYDTNNNSSLNDVESMNSNIVEQGTVVPVAKLTALFTGTMYDEENNRNNNDNNDNNTPNTPSTTINDTINITIDDYYNERIHYRLDDDNKNIAIKNNKNDLFSVDKHYTDIENHNKHQSNKIRTTSYHDMPTNCTGIILSNEEVYDTLQPCRTRNELLRDTILIVLDNKYFVIINTIVLVLIIADGALFFFLLIGLHQMCSTDNNNNNNISDECHPRNYWYNWSIQVLTILFTYMVTISMPWRCIQLYHTIGSTTNNSKSCCKAPIKRTNTIGYNLYGIYCNDIWYYIPLRQRKYILVLLLLNAICQYLNQGTRIVHYKYVHQDTYPGYIWTNVFFGLSFFFAFISLLWIVYEFYKIRHCSILINDNKITNNVVKDDTRKTSSSIDKFGPGPIDSLKYAVSNLVSKIKTKKTTEE